VTDSWQGVEY